MNPITVMVTGLGGGGVGEQILKALKMASQDYEIVGVDMDPRSMGLQTVKHPYIVPPASNPGYIDTIAALCERHGVNALLPGSEQELEQISRYKERFVAGNVFVPINPSAVIQTCLDKVKTMNFLDREGFSYPRYLPIASPTDLHKINFLPVVLKPSSGSGGSVNTFIAQTDEELHLFGKYLLDLAGPFICQEYVGTPENEYTVGILLGMDGGLINSIAVRRSIVSGLSCHLKVPNRTGRSELGAHLVISSGISQGTIGKYHQVTGECEKIALALGCTGAVNIQCRMVNGSPCVFEINPRFSGTTSLRAMVGYNEPDVLIRKHVRGEKIPNGFSYNSGVICRGLKELHLSEAKIPIAVDC